MSNESRFIIIEGSYTAHCCFQYSVIDTAKGKDKTGMWKHCVCETIDEEDAKNICQALNENIDPDPIIDTNDSVQEELNINEAKNILKDEDD